MAQQLTTTTTKPTTPSTTIVTVPQIKKENLQLKPFSKPHTRLENERMRDYRRTLVTLKKVHRPKKNKQVIPQLQLEFEDHEKGIFLIFDLPFSLSGGEIRGKVSSI